MSQYDFDLFVIGAGSAGVRAARMAAGQGKKVAVAENLYLGGTCVNVGCVPKKLFVYASEYPHIAKDAKGYGLDFSLNAFDWPTLRDNKTAEIERLNKIYQSLLDNSGAKTIWGKGKVTGAHTVAVGEDEYSAEKILLATGGWPIIPDIPGKEYFITTNEVFYLDTFPKEVLVVGSGYIAVEFAGIFNGLGAKTTIASRSGKLLRGFDEDTRVFAEQEILKKGPKLVPEQPKSIEQLSNGRLRVSFEQYDSLEVDTVLCATGRKPNVENLGLEQNGIELTQNGTVKVDKYYATSVPSIFAMGDLIDGPQLTPVALAEAMAFLRQQYGNSKAALNYDNIPTAVFSQPNLATVGLSEEAAIKKGHDIVIFQSDFKAMKHTLTDSQERTFMKLVVDKNSDQVLGAHMVGDHAGEMMQGIAVALKAGATKANFDETIGIHPTSAEEFVTMRSPVKK